MAQSFTLQTAQQFINELAEHKAEINVCTVNKNSSPVKLIDVKNMANKKSASPADIQYATLVAELIKGRFELPITIKVFIENIVDPDIVGLHYETDMYKFVMKNILEPRYSPNFVSFVASGCCSGSRCYLMTEKVGSGLQFGKNKLFPVKSLSELYPVLKLKEKYQILFQVIYSLEVMAKFKMTHNDLHANNILVMILDEAVVLQYTVDTKTFTVKTKFIPYIFDWDHGFVEFLGPNGKIDSSFSNDFNVDNSFDSIRDIYTLFCYLEYLKNKDKDNTTLIGATYVKNPTLMAKEEEKMIPIERNVKENVEHNFQHNRMVYGTKIYKLSSSEFESFVGKNIAPLGMSEIYFFFKNSKNIVLWNPFLCRLSSKSRNFPTPAKFLENQFKMFETVDNIETPFSYRLPTDEEVKILTQKDKTEEENEHLVKDILDGKTYGNGQLHSFDEQPAVIDHDDGTKYWYKNGKLHRDNGPAKIWSNGDEQWWQNGLLHRDNDLPAVNNTDGTQKWYQNGELHRGSSRVGDSTDAGVDLPAVIEADGTQKYYQNGELHRDNDLPAVVYINGTRKYYRNGVLHRNDNPAVVRANGDDEGWYNGQRTY